MFILFNLNDTIRFDLIFYFHHVCFQRQLQEVRGQMDTEMRNHQRTRDQLQASHKQVMDLKQQVGTLFEPQQEKKPPICIIENKGADQLRSNCEADQRLCFRYTDGTISLLSKFTISCACSALFVPDLLKNHMAGFQMMWLISV